MMIDYKVVRLVDDGCLYVLDTNDYSLISVLNDTSLRNNLGWMRLI